MSESRAPEVRDLGHATFGIDGPLGIVTLNRPQVLNAQSYELLAQVDHCQPRGPPPSPAGVLADRRKMPTRTPLTPSCRPGNGQTA